MFQLLLKCNSYPVWSNANRTLFWNYLCCEFIQVKNVDQVLTSISHSYITKLFFKVHLNLVFRDVSSFELVCINIYLNFAVSIVITPRKLLYLLSLLCWLIILTWSCATLITADQNRVAAVNLSITFKVLSTISVKVFIGMSIIILDKES